MKNIIFAVIVAAISANAAAAVTCTNFGTMTTCNGYDQNGQSVNTTTQQFGTMTTTTGSIGSAPVNTTTQQFGNMQTTTGYVGGQSVQQTCTQFGNMTTCN